MQCRPEKNGDGKSTLTFLHFISIHDYSLNLPHCSHNSSPKFAPHDYVRQVLLGYCSLLYEKKGYKISWVQFYWLFVSPPHSSAYYFAVPILTISHQGTLCIQAAVCLSCSVCIWSAFHCAVVTVISHCTDHPVIILFTCRRRMGEVLKG